MRRTIFHLIRHAVVEPGARGVHYGITDVGLCEDTLGAQADIYTALADRLPYPAHWVVTPLSRTLQTAEAIFAAGYPHCALNAEPGLLEQDIGAWHGLAHNDLPPRLRQPAHPFWPMAAEEVTPGGESMLAVIRRVGATLERLADTHTQGHIVIIGHGGAIRAAIGHALAIPPEAALRLAVDNLSLTQLERRAGQWQAVRINDAAAAARWTSGEVAP